LISTRFVRSRLSLTLALQLSGTSSSSAAAGTRDIQFVHAYIVYQLLSRRIQRDLLLITTLFSSQSPSPSRASKQTGVSSLKPKKEQVDARLYPAVVKLLDTVLQSLDQMRSLSIVDESPDLASAVEARLSFTKARRSFGSHMFGPCTEYFLLQMFIHRSLLCPSEKIRRSSHPRPAREYLLP
jgi:signal recognition particle subunit SRP68